MFDREATFSRHSARQISQLSGVDSFKGLDQGTTFSPHLLKPESLEKT